MQVEQGACNLRSREEDGQHVGLIPNPVQGLPLPEAALPDGILQAHPASEHPHFRSSIPLIAKRFAGNQ